MTTDQTEAPRDVETVRRAVNAAFQNFLATEGYDGRDSFGRDALRLAFDAGRHVQAAVAATSQPAPGQAESVGCEACGLHRPPTSAENLAGVPGASTAGQNVQMASDGDGGLKPVGEFTRDEKWWCDGEDCDGQYGGPHVHPYVGPALVVDLLTGRDTGQRAPDGA